MSKYMPLNEQDKRALHKLDVDFNFNDSGEIATISGNMKVTIIRPPPAGSGQFLMTIEFPNNELFDIRLSREQFSTLQMTNPESRSGP